MYSPKIREDLIPLLYQLKLCLDKPMTEILDDIALPKKRLLLINSSSACKM